MDFYYYYCNNKRKPSNLVAGSAAAIIKFSRRQLLRVWGHAWRAAICARRWPRRNIISLCPPPEIHEQKRKLHVFNKPAVPHPYTPLKWGRT
jgi:hypothetical protein